MTSDAVIDIDGLVKQFGSFRALDGLDLRLLPGEVHGFLGPNGAGKSTTIRVLLGLLRKDGGEVRLFGSDPWRHAAELHRRLAYVPGDVNLWPNLTGGEVIDLLGRLRGGIEDARRTELIEAFELDPTKKGRAYSKGNRQKVALVAALASDVELLILDEPTSGLDPLMESVFQRYVEAFRERGHAVLLSSHILAEVEELCDRVSIIRAGKVVEAGTLADLRHLTRTSIQSELERPPAGLEAVDSVHDLVVEGTRVRFQVDTARMDDALKILVASGVRSLTSRPPTLEELFLRHYGDEIGGMTGTLSFVRNFLRRDRWMLLWWILGGVLLYLATVYSVDQLYPTQADYDAAASSMEGNAAFIAMAGPARGLDTLGGQTAWQTTAFGAILAGLMSMFVVGRHTRAEEETGRDELLRAAAVGRFAPTTAALLVALFANLILGVMVSLGLTAYGLAAPDSFGLGLGLTACGWLFTGTALVAVQLTASTRSAYAVAGLVIGVSYVLRAIGDVGNGVLSWFSPIGWYQAMHQFSGLRWWPMLLMVTGAAVATCAAYALFSRRDYGSGVWATRPGPARAGGGLGTGLGLAWRLHRGAVLGWAAAMFLAGLAYGAIGDDVGSLIGDSKASQEIFVQSGSDLVDGFYATAVLMLAVICCGFSVSSTMRPHGEETDGHLEVLLASALPRRGWLLGHVAVTVGGSVLILASSGLGLGAGYLLVTGEGGEAWALTWPALQYVAPVLVLSAVGRVLFGMLPRLMVLAWVPLVLAAVVMLFGDLFTIPPWVQDLSPFEHLPMVPAESFSWTPVLVLTSVALLLSVVGQIAFARRDVH